MPNTPHTPHTPHTPGGVPTTSSGTGDTDDTITHDLGPDLNFDPAAVIDGDGSGGLEGLLVVSEYNFH